MDGCITYSIFLNELLEIDVVCLPASNGKSAVASDKFVTDFDLKHWKSTCRLLASSFSQDMCKNGRWT